MKQQSVFSKTLHKKYRAVEGGLSFPVEDLHNHPVVRSKIEEMKALLKKHPIPMDLLKKNK